MRRFNATFVLAVAAIVLAASCGSSSKSSSSSPTTTAGGGSSSSSSSSPRSSTTLPKAKATPAVLRAVLNKKLGVKILVDARGRTVYLYMPDGTSVTSKVPAGIKSAWPPVVGTRPVRVGSGVTRARVVLHKQSSGMNQVAYHGHLLYTFSGDTKPGETKGQGLGGIWYAVTPAGTKAA